MNCLKCGRETTDGHAFCDECLKIMEQYPVKPGTPVHIPRRKVYEDAKPSRRKKEESPEEHLENLQNMVHWLSIAVVTLLAAMILMSFFILKDFLIPEEPETPMGRNYTVSHCYNDN